jgi:hypothetical protein
VLGPDLSDRGFFAASSILFWEKWSMPEKQWKKIEFTISPDQEKELQWLVERSGVNRSDTLRLVIGEAYRKAKGEDHPADRVAEGDGGVRP